MTRHRAPTARLILTRHRSGDQQRIWARLQVPGSIVRGFIAKRHERDLLKLMAEDERCHETDISNWSGKQLGWLKRQLESPDILSIH